MDAGYASEDIVKPNHLKTVIFNLQKTAACLKAILKKICVIFSCIRFSWVKLVGDLHAEYHFCCAILQ